VELLDGDSENSSRDKSGDIKLGARTSKHILVFVFTYLSTQLYLFISFIAIIAYSYMFDTVLTLVFIQESIEAHQLL